MAGIRKGETACPTPERKTELEQLVAEQREKRREEKKRAAEEKRQKDEEQKRAAEQKKIDTNNASIQKDEYALRLEESKRRMEEITRKAQSEVNTGSARPANWAQQQLETLGRGESVATTPAATNKAPVTPTVSAGPMFILKPQLQEQRTISLPAAPPAPLSTFMCGTPPNQYSCPVLSNQGNNSAPPPQSESPTTPIVTAPPTRVVTPEMTKRAGDDISKLTDKAAEQAARDNSCWGSCLTTKGTLGRWCKKCRTVDWWFDDCEKVCQ